MKEMQVEINQLKPQGRYITEQERKALLQVSTYVYAIWEYKKNRLCTLYKQIQQAA